MPRLVAVTGATGFIGRALVSRLLDEGWRVRLLARRLPDFLPASSDALQIVPGDLADRTALDRLVAGVDAVAHLAGAIKARSAAEFMATNRDGVVLIDASALGTKVKEGKNQKTLLSAAEEQRIVATFNAREAVEDFSVVVDHAAIAAKNYSLSAGQYFEVRIEYEDLTAAQFGAKIATYQKNLAGMFDKSRELEGEITEAIEALTHGH